MPFNGGVYEDDRLQYVRCRGFLKMKVPATNEKSRNRKPFHNAFPDVGGSIFGGPVSQKPYILPDPPSLDNANLPPNRCPQIHNFMTLFSRCFQIRDDYQRLVSANVPKNSPNSCENLDQGKFSLPLIHSLQQTQPPGSNILLTSLLQQRHKTGKMTSEAKKLILEEFERIGSMAYTRSILQGPFSQLQKEIEGLETHFRKAKFRAEVAG
jgi:hypothetical protein